MKILDCTIRDGGYVNNWNFSKKDAVKIYKSVSDAGVDYCEIGFIGPKKKGSGLFQALTQKDIEMFETYSGVPKAVMINYKQQPTKIPTNIEMIRVAVHRNKALDAIKYAETFCDSFITSIQLMGYSTMSEIEKQNIVDRLSASELDYAYVADSYGSMTIDSINSNISQFIGKINVGFHPHNNIQMAFANAVEADKCGASIVDASILGMGRGAGNLPLELILTYLKNKYNPVPILNCIETTMKKYKTKYDWGYNPKFMLTGSFNLHPYYANQERKIERVWDSLQEISSKTVGYSQEVLDEIINNEVDLKLTISPTEVLYIDRNKIINNITLPPIAKKIINIGELVAHYHIFKKYTPYKKSIKSLKNTKKNKRLFIIATGPSLNKTDLSLLKNESMMGVNTLYRGVKDLDLHLEYYVVGDPPIFSSQYKGILQTNTKVFLSGAPGHYYVNNKAHYDKYSNSVIYPIQRLGRMNIMSDFSKDLTKGVFSSGSVTLHCLQIAYYLGFKEVYLIGCDCDYSKSHHFDGKRTINPDAPILSSDEGKNRVFKGYEICKRAFEKDGRKVYNATVGGKLEVFERVKLEDLQ